MDWSEFQSHCMPIIVQKLLEKYGKEYTSQGSYMDVPLATDYEFESIWEALFDACELDEEYDEESDANIFYISDANIMDFYKLAFEHKRFSEVSEMIDFSMNEIHNNFNLPSYCYDYALPSEEYMGIKFYMYPEFETIYRLLEAILDTVDYFEAELPKLKFTIWQCLFKEQNDRPRLPQNIERRVA